jgi:hypothetical protein
MINSKVTNIDKDSKIITIENNKQIQNCSVLPIQPKIFKNEENLKPQNTVLCQMMKKEKDEL